MQSGAWQGRIGDVEDAALRASFELNFFAHQHVAQAATAVFQAQETGGVLLFNASKQAVNPGPDFGPYGLPKAATMFLSRQYALDYGAEGIRSNAVNADRIRSGMLDDAFIAERAEARGLSPQAYMRDGNLLKREVKARDSRRRIRRPSACGEDDRCSCHRRWREYCRGFAVRRDGLKARCISV